MEGLKYLFVGACKLYKVMKQHKKNAGVQLDKCATDLHSISVAFSKYCKHVLKVEVCDDFLEVASSAMVRLKAGNRSTVVYYLAKGIGTSRKDEAESRFPVGIMPMGLVEYTANFFVTEYSNSVNYFIIYRANYIHIFIIVHRSHIVLLTTDLGCRLCTVTLGRNGQNFIMALFGVWRILFTFPMNMSNSQ